MATHAHAHSHSDRSRDTSAWRLTAAIAFNGVLVVVQVAAGLAAGSLALLGDALHNLNDTASLGVALVAERVAERRADRRRTFGYRRAQVIGALINLTTLVVIGLYLMVQAVERFFSPQPVSGWTVVAVAGAALAVDAATTAMLWAGAKQGVNLRAAFVHSLSDALASVGVILAGTAILLWQWWWADPLITLAIAGYVLYQGLSMMRQAVHVLLESVPADLVLEELVREVETVEGVRELHHVHVWELDEQHRAMEAHVVIAPHDAAALERIKAAVKQRLAERFEIGHSTLEFEFEPEPGTERAGEHRDVVPEH